MIDFLKYLWLCYRVYREPGDLQYFAVMSYGVPRLTVMIGRDREAWRVSQFATESFRRIGI